MWFIQQAVYDTTAKLPDGRTVTLDFVLDDTRDGYISTQNGYVVNQIRSAIASRSGGWLEITEAEYNEALKKKAEPSRRKSKSLSAGMFQLRANDPAVPVVAAKPAPITVPTPEQMKLPPRPRVGKMVVPT